MSVLLEILAVKERPHGGNIDRALEDLTLSISKTISGFRVVRRNIADGIRLEPFSGAISFVTLLERRTHRADAIAGLRALAMICFLSYESVRIKKYGADKPQEARDFGETDFDLAMEVLIENPVAIVAITPPCLRFRLRQVEARLFSPTVGPDGNAVAGFFCTMEAVAPSQQQGIELVRRALADEGAALIGWNEIEVVEISTNNLLGAYRVSGRAFFSGNAFDS